jgi:hypothetical protein
MVFDTDDDLEERQKTLAERLKNTKQYATTYDDLEPIVKARALLNSCESMLQDCDPTAGFSLLDEEYKIASRHTFPIDEIAKLESLVNKLYTVVTAVRAGYCRSTLQATPATSQDHARVVNMLTQSITKCATLGELAPFELVAKRGY